MTKTTNLRTAEEATSFEMSTVDLFAVQEAILEAESFTGDQESELEPSDIANMKTLLDPLKKITDFLLNVRKSENYIITAE